MLLYILFLSLLIHFLFLGYVNSVAFSPNGMYIATGSSDKTVAILDVNSRKVLKKFTDIHTSI
jgi:WD40 repeat protein